MFLRIFAVAVLMMLALRSALAATEINVIYGLPWLFKDAHETIAKDFMAKNPDIKVNLLAPAKSYEEVATAILRAAAGGTVPDVAYSGTNLLPMLADRGIAVPLDGLIKAERNWNTLGYIPAMLTTSQVAGVQYGLPFAISTPIAYYNIDLVKRAGWDPEKLPRTWDEVLALSDRMNAIGGDVRSMYIHWQTTGNYIWQALLFSHGGTLLTPDRKRVAFESPEGLRTLELLRQFTQRAKMPNYTREQGRQDFTAGKLGMQYSSSAELALVTKQIGDRFTLRTAPWPTPDGQSRIVSGGATATLLAKDPAKQRAAWEYIKYATGAMGQTTMVRFTGYNPSNQIAIDTPNLLGEHYAKTPNAKASLVQLQRATAWQGFPGDNGIKIVDTINDTLESVVTLKSIPKDALSRMAKEANALLPK